MIKPNGARSAWIVDGWNLELGIGLRYYAARR